MSTIQTVLGALPVEDLGQALVHEHLGTGAACTRAARQRILGFLLPELEQLKDWRCRTIFDASPDHRNLEFMAQIARLSGLNIIASTGFYVHEAIPVGVRDLDATAIAAHLIAGIAHGEQTTGIKCGLIKLASNTAPLTDLELKVFAAGAEAQRKTGVPIVTHAIRNAREELDVLEAAGVDPNRVMLSHVDFKPGPGHLGYLASLAGRGAYLCFTSWGCRSHASMEALVDLVRGLLDRGYVNRVTMSNDVGFGLRTKLVGGVEQSEIEIPWYEGQDVPHRCYSYLYTHAVPRLKAGGVTERELGVILAENPRRLLAPSSGRGA
jgi:phosphotriesterase-related protein